ncbi:MAG: LptA/OstA family protein [Verrucomicrobiota bacterium]
MLLICAAPLRSAAQNNGEGENNAEAGSAPPSEPPRELQITADSVDMQMDAGKAGFEGNVVVLDRGLRIESQTMEVNLNEAGAMTEAVFSGEVSIAQEQQDRAATAEHAVYNMAQGELVLTGKPTLREGERTLRNAQKIIYNRMTGRIRTEGTRDGGRPTLIIPLAADNKNADDNPDGNNNKNTDTNNGERK